MCDPKGWHTIVLYGSVRVYADSMCASLDQRFSLTFLAPVQVTAPDGLLGGGVSLVIHILEESFQVFILI